TEMSALQIAILLGGMANRPDLAIAFINHSQNLHQKSPDQWSAMDYAVSGFLAAQTSSSRQTYAAAQILLALHDKGVALSDAGEMYKASSGMMKDYGSLARGSLGIDALSYARLISPDEARILFEGHPALKQTILNTADITAELIEKHGGKI